MSIPVQFQLHPAECGMPRAEFHSKTSWAALTDPFTDHGENAQHQNPTLISSQITCALHPTLSGKGGVFRTLNRLRMK
ncbi:hypothetical protein N7478_009129 [Penicillium angulare]|uniref:uncharacterized protein n=1 Tax=Penicillium angulare TaxID=116970 RepID=UPI00253F8D9B|nr:uncharacterized protein N7478_009129 [Penicillium angulare]KAJ5274004.1 hypothetical protein N7478_009129 [Penicillium angulare]